MVLLSQNTSTNLQTKLRESWQLFEELSHVLTANASVSGVCKYHIGPIGDLSLLNATAAAHVHSLHWLIKIKIQKWCCCVLLLRNQIFDTRTPPPPLTASVAYISQQQLTKAGTGRSAPESIHPKHGRSAPNFWDVPPLVLGRSAPTPIGLSISYFAPNSSTEPTIVDLLLQFVTFRV